MLKPKLLQQEQGFTLVEVLVAILITTLFVSVTMQGMVIAAIFKAKAQEHAETTTWIQEDLENVKYQAAILQFPQTTLAAAAVKDTSTIIVTSASIFAVNDTLRVGLDPINYTISAIAANTLTITPVLAANQLINTAVVATKMCNPQGVNAQNEGLADAVRDKILMSEGSPATVINPNNVASTKTFRMGKSFSRRRTTTLSGNFPHNVLQVRYEVSQGSTFNPNPLQITAKFDTEVIPDVAFKCP